VGARQLWLETLWPNILGALPPPPAGVVEIGCGSHGGFIPALIQDGYQAVGIDPVAPEGAHYERVEFEQAELPTELDAIIACTSLHHVADPRLVVDRMADHLAPGGVVVIVEWDWESFDEPTATWCFDHLGPEDHGPEDHDSWLHHQRRQWTESGQSWEDYLRSWASDHGIHPVAALLDQLDRCLERQSHGRGAYFFPDLVNITEADELRAISEGRIQATRIDDVGRVSESARQSFSG
jgi:SAM-dependent methyltransferase